MPQEGLWLSMAWPSPPPQSPGLRDVCLLTDSTSGHPGSRRGQRDRGQHPKAGCTLLRRSLRQLLALEPRAWTQQGPALPLSLFPPQHSRAASSQGCARPAPLHRAGDCSHRVGWQGLGSLGRDGSRHNDATRTSASAHSPVGKVIYSARLPLLWLPSAVLCTPKELPCSQLLACVHIWMATPCDHPLVHRHTAS